jgi:hypothetical protein
MLTAKQFQNIRGIRKADMEPFVEMRILHVDINGVWLKNDTYKTYKWLSENNWEAVTFDNVIQPLNSFGENNGK